MHRTIKLTAAAVMLAITVVSSTNAFARVWRAAGSGIAPSSSGNVGLTNGLARRCIFVPGPHNVQHQVCF